MTIHTLIDISDGAVPSLGEQYISNQSTNVSRLIDIIMMYSPPFLTRVDSQVVNFDRAKNRNYYKMKHLTGSHTVYTIKFAVANISMEHLASTIHGMPVIVPTLTSVGKLKRFVTVDGPSKNTTIHEDRLTTVLS